MNESDSFDGHRKQTDLNIRTYKDKITKLQRLTRRKNRKRDVQIE
jgi:hypothetical protein